MRPETQEVTAAEEQLLQSTEFPKQSDFAIMKALFNRRVISNKKMFLYLVFIGTGIIAALLNSLFAPKLDL
jgi:hypothetical protein